MLEHTIRLNTHKTMYLTGTAQREGLGGALAPPPPPHFLQV